MKLINEPIDSFSYLSLQTSKIYTYNIYMSHSSHQELKMPPFLIPLLICIFLFSKLSL